MSSTLLADLLPSWQLALKAERKSQATLDGYRWGVHSFLKWCAESGTEPSLSKSTVQAFIAALLDSGAAGATARARYAALRRYAAWLAEEGEIDRNELLDVKPPKVDVKVTPSLTDDQLKALLKACSGKAFIDRRDEAIVRLLAEAGCRSSELLGMEVVDVDATRGLAVIRKGKGGKGRVVPFGPQTAAAIDRYLRARRTHRLADTNALWLGGGGQTFGYHGLDLALKKRAAAAGIEQRFHNHLMRHTTATRWLRAGGSESGLMSVAGWSTRSMMDRYIAASASELAAEESRKLGLGDL